MKLNVKKLQKAGTIPLKEDYQFYKRQYNPKLRQKIETRIEANKPINTTSEFIFDPKTMKRIPNPNAKMGLEIVSPEFQIMTAGVGSLGNKAVSTAGKIGQTMLHGASQGAMANMSNLSGSEQNLEGLATDVLGGVVVGGVLKGVEVGGKLATPLIKKSIQSVSTLRNINNKSFNKFKTLEEANNFDLSSIPTDKLSKILKNKTGKSLQELNLEYMQKPDNDRLELYNQIYEIVHPYLKGKVNKSGLLPAFTTKNSKYIPSFIYKNTILKGNDRLGFRTTYKGLKNIPELNEKDYTNLFNENISKLNEIISKNNRSGIPYSVDKLNYGNLIINSEVGPSEIGVKIKPGLFTGKIKQINNEQYIRDIPGMQITNSSSSVFGDRIPRRGSRFYESLNEYLTSQNLGRVKSGLNSQTDYSRGLWNNYNKQGKAVGYYDDPNTIYSIMRKQGGKLIPKGQQGLILNKFNTLSPLDPNKQFNKSEFNFLNLPKQKPLLNFMSMGNIGYDSNTVLKLIDDFEGFKDKVYKDGKGIDTIGHGLTDKKYISKGTITKEESLSGVKSHIDKEVLPHLKNKPYWNNLNGNQKSALISYIYNIGSGNFNTKSPSLQKALLEGNWDKAAKQMDFGYNDIKNPGLKERRDKERQLFLQ